jgi:hypothetical protein
METPQHQSVVICADDLRALYPSPRQQFKVGLACVAICAPVFLLGEFLRMEWIGVVAILLCAVLFVVPLVLNIQRFLAALPCGTCGKAAGRHTTAGGVLHLKCDHCGNLTRTDCLWIGPGKPTRI